MAKVFDISVVGFICCNLRPAHASDVLLFTLDPVKFPAETEPIPATVVSVLEDQVVPNVDGTGTDTGTIYTVSVEDVDMPPGLDELDEVDIVGFDCPGCCTILENRQLRDSILVWSPSEAVKTGDYRIANDIIWKSNSDRTTGASFDVTEQANWTQVFADSSAGLAAEIVARSDGDAALQAQLDALTPAELGITRSGKVSLSSGPGTQSGTVVFSPSLPDANYILFLQVAIPDGGSRLAVAAKLSGKLASAFDYELSDDVPATGYELHYHAIAI